jgi:hypothetical protein
VKNIEDSINIVNNIPVYPEWNLRQKLNNRQYETKIKNRYYMILVNEIFGNQFGSYRFTVALQRMFYPDYSHGYPIFKAINANEYKVPIEFKMFYTLDEADAYVLDIQDRLPCHCLEDML